MGRNIFFVSAARSLGFPARINEVNGKPQYYKDGNWYDVDYEKAKKIQEKEDGKANRVERTEEKDKK